MVPPYGLKEQSYFVKSKPKDEPIVEPKEEKLEVKGNSAGYHIPAFGASDVESPFEKALPLQEAK